MTRRDFVKTSAKGVALASIPFVFRVNPLKAFEGPVAESRNLSDYYTHFGVNEDVIRQVMAAALEKGGDYCDVYFEHAMSNMVALEDDLVNQASSDVAFGVGIRVVEGDQTGYSFTEEITPESMKLAAKTAANIANQTKTAPPQKLKLHNAPEYYQVDQPWQDVGIDQKIPCLQKINEKMRQADSRIIKTQVYFLDYTSWILVANSTGRIACDYRPMTRVYALCTAEQDGRKEENYESYGGRRGLERYSDEFIDHLAATAVRKTIDLFEAVPMQGGEMEVVLAPGNAGIILHEAIGHGMEADYTRKGESLFADKIGKPVAESFVSIVDDGTLPYHRGSINVDDEGNDTQRTYLVKDGILLTYMHDYISSRHYGIAPTGNGRRQSFRHVPIPRMTNTFMLNGPHTREEIIASVKKGLYAEAFTNGEVNIGPGDFTFYLKSGYLIEDGKMTRPVKDVNIIGNGPDVLTKMVMVGNDMLVKESAGTCGKAGQSCPVTDGLPTTKVSSITVGGSSS
ncbi:MAG: TldD/PmbA family protein [Candidatus Zixiibacteriota bacterium]|nr:MAG: TldD/PmbA family protein [candidate division Zixibacteria bacterium]